ncbi:MAG: carbamoyl-phosphate synthase large subunit [Cognaticolwellia sp.]|jgi:carbamoyl-phosphate synthase large subunit
MRTRILVTGAGGAAAVSYLRAMQGHQFSLYAADMDSNATGLYMVGPTKRFLIPPASAANYVESILELCEREQIDILVPTVDMELLPISERRADFEAAGTKLLLAPQGCLELCLDKWKLMQACGPQLPVPQSAVLTEDLELSSIPLPCIVKPRDGAGGRGFKIINTPIDWADQPRDGSMLIQEYLPGDEYSVDVLIDADGTFHAAVPRLRMKVDSGVAVTARTVRDTELMDLSERVARVIGLRFVGNIQWRRRADGRPALLEVNPRFPGTMPLTIAAGVDMPQLSTASLMGHAIHPLAPFEEIAIVRRWEEILVSPRALESVPNASAPLRRHRVA